MACVYVFLRVSGCKYVWGGGGCCGIVEENGGWRVRGVIEISLSV